MGRKRPLAEVIQLNSKRQNNSKKNKPIYYREGIFELSNHWEAWVLVDAKEADYDFLEEGTLDECLFALTNFISFEVTSKFLRHNLEPEEWSRKQQERREEIKQECYRQGRYEGMGWVIESVVDKLGLESMIEEGFFEPIQ
ncbi:hypothetical protein [Nostoc sp. 2RC]|uniref:hypothetical protein n=1 Tax=Nostoc sp. 2RC TaxID=2485484 RepID=UPI001629AF04|nr:hypothetical protein [Nostoc sp. 2RC]MBC1238666.1 hypothetical protein [Nostoc sp. 2RC]